MAGLWHVILWVSALGCELRFEGEADASFKVELGEHTWLRSGSLRLFANGAWHDPSTGMGPRSSRSYEASDDLGRFHCLNVTWELHGPGEGVVHTSFQVYSDTCAVVFVQEVPQGAQGTNASAQRVPKDGHRLDEGAYPPSLAFPSFESTSFLTHLGYLTWKGTFGRAVYGTNVLADLAGLSGNGPVVLFDSHRALVVSPLDNFKSAVHTSSSGIWETGVTSELASLPVGFRHRTLIQAGAARLNFVAAALCMPFRGPTLVSEPNRRFEPDSPLNNIIKIYIIPCINEESVLKRSQPRWGLPQRSRRTVRPYSSFTSFNALRSTLTLW